MDRMADRLPVALDLPRLPAWLAATVARADSPGLLPPPGAPLVVPGLDPQRVALAARDALRQWAAVLRPIEARRLAFWLAPLNLRRDPPLSATALHTRAAGLLPDLVGVPAPVLHIGTQAEALGAFQGLPRGSELRRLLLPHAEAVARRRAVLRRLAETPAAAPRPAPDAAERAAVAAKAAAFRDEMRRLDPLMAPAERPPGARLLTPQQVLDHWRRAAEEATGTPLQGSVAAGLARAEAEVAELADGE